MSHTLYKQIKDEDMVSILASSQFWHFATDQQGDKAIICTGEFIGDGAGSGWYIPKTVERGGITCPKCMKIIREYKAIKL